MDNVFIERLWRSLKYECVYLQPAGGARPASGDTPTGGMIDTRD